MFQKPQNIQTHDTLIPKGMIFQPCDLSYKVTRIVLEKMQRDSYYQKVSYMWENPIPERFSEIVTETPWYLVFHEEGTSVLTSKTSVS
jgi:hypothetical protein